MHSHTICTLYPGFRLEEGFLRGKPPKGPIKSQIVNNSYLLLD